MGKSERLYLHPQSRENPVVVKRVSAIRCRPGLPSRFPDAVSSGSAVASSSPGGANYRTA